MGFMDKFAKKKQPAQPNGNNQSDSEFFERLKDPGFYKENRTDPHSDHIIHAPEDKMTDTVVPSIEDSSLYFLLNGSWKFHYSENFEGRPEGFEAADFNVSGWADIRVPGSIQMQGYDIPQYVNVQYPWDGKEELQPGQVPQKFNPTASYVRRFELPENFRGKRIFISFQGVESCFRVWLNGSYIGFSSDSFTPSEFELTDFLHKGENVLAVQVYKWYPGSWLEDQDFFRFSGIFRDVYLYAAPKYHMRDIKITADAGKLDVTVHFLDAVAAVRAQLSDPEGKILQEKDFQSAMISNKGGGNIRFSLKVDDPELWSAEYPKLYTLKLTSLDEKGREMEWTVQKVGFRHFEMDGNIMKLNGRRIVFKGVNRHEFSADNARTVTDEELLKDLYTMKRSNINAIRLSHYPNSSHIYYLADVLGFYLIDECNMETHGTWDAVERGVQDADYILPSDHTEYQEMLLDRAASMYQRDKNHPCILIWSCGNESFGGSVIHKMRGYFKKQDPARLVHYEGVVHDQRFPDTTDMESQMYPSVQSIKDFLADHRDRPFICCEYSHAMGNSCGALYKYTDLTDEDELYQGGFIWDYVDQAIRATDRYGSEYYAYGGDLGDRPNDGNFSGDGLVYPDRNPTPKLAEVKYCYQSIKTQISENSFRVINKYLFTGSDAFDCAVILLKNGVCINEKPVQTSVPAMSAADYDLPFAIPDEPGEYCAAVSFRLKKDTAWAAKGHEVAYDQRVFEKGSSPLFGWGSEDISQINKGGKDGFRIIRGSYNIGVQDEDFEVLFSRLYGGLVSYRYKGREMLAGQVRPNFWRAPTDNDLGNMMPFRYAQWKSASMYMTHMDPNDMSAAFRMVNPEIKASEGSVEIKYTYYLPVVPVQACSLTYIVTKGSGIQAILEFDPPENCELPDFPEYSIMFKMDADYHNMQWYGSGPQDCYADRKSGAKLGIFSSDARAQQAAYLRPQESGCHTDVRWMKVTDDEGHGLMFECECQDVNVSPWSPHETENALHPFELPKEHYTYVRIGQQMGIGGDDSWGAMVHDEFLLSSKVSRKVSLRFTGI